MCPSVLTVMGKTNIQRHTAAYKSATAPPKCVKKLNSYGKNVVTVNSIVEASARAEAYNKVDTKTKKI